MAKMFSRTIGMRYTDEKKTFDFYPTEPYYPKKLLQLERIDGTVLEPAAGDGAMVNVLKAAGLDVTGQDYKDYGGGFPLVDFMFFDEKGTYDNVITNPPFSLFTEFASKALGVARKKVALIYYPGGMCSYKVSTFLKAHPPKVVYLLVKKMTVNGKPSIFNHCWIVWDKEYTGPTQLDTVLYSKKFKVGLDLD